MDNGKNGGQPARNNKSWTRGEDQLLIKLVARGNDDESIAKTLHRTIAAIRVRRNRPDIIEAVNELMAKTAKELFGQDEPLEELDNNEAKSKAEPQAEDDDEADIIVIFQGQEWHLDAGMELSIKPTRFDPGFSIQVIHPLEDA